MAWRKLYANIIGFSVYYVCINIFGRILLKVDIDTEPQKYLTLLLIICILPVILIILTNRLNAVMMKKTGTNAELIRGFVSGEFDSMIPAKLNNEAGRRYILKCLANGKATSINGAILLANKRNFDKKIGRGILGVFALMDKAVDSIIEENRNLPVIDIRGAVENFFNGSGSVPVTDNTWKISREKDKAVFLETQAKNAEYANRGSYGAQRAKNIALGQRQKANNMR